MKKLWIHNHRLSLDGQPGQHVLSVLQQHHVPLESPCGGGGKCGKCRIKWRDGHLNEPTLEERLLLSAAELHDGIRLACLARLTDDATIDLLQSQPATGQILTEGFAPDIAIHPVIRKQHIYPEIGYPALPGRHRAPNPPPEPVDAPVTAVYYADELIGIERGDTRHQLYGVALDIGTTTVVGALIDLNNGAELATESQINPQKDYGLDVLSRISVVADQAALSALHKIIIDCIQQMIDRLCAQADIDKARVYEIVVAANTTMLHLLLNINPAGLGRFPYTPAFFSAQRARANDLNLSISPFGQLYTLPIVSGFIGGDIVAGALVAGLEHRKNALFIDIGTNGEMILAHDGKLSACSCAAGPALEGMNISMGMRAAPGAIEQVCIHDDETVELQTIGHLPAQGLCGSGIVSAVAEIVRTRQVGKTGRIRVEGKLIANDQAQRKVVLCAEPRRISVSQDDIRQVQLAKGAILSGMITLLEQNGLTADDLDELLIAGQFGQHLTADSLVDIGMIPAALKDKITYLGNTSKTGARSCLLSREERVRAQQLSTRVQYHELAVSEDFNRLFVSCLNFY